MSYRGTNLNSGIVSFHQDKVRRDASISSDGTYQIAEMEPGDYRVTVEARPVKTGPPPAWAKPKVEIPGQPKVAGPALKPVQVDPRYSDMKSSGLRYNIGAGVQTIDVELK